MRVGARWHCHVDALHVSPPPAVANRELSEPRGEISHRICNCLCQVCCLQKAGGDGLWRLGQMINWPTFIVGVGFFGEATVSNTGHPGTASRALRSKISILFLHPDGEMQHKNITGYS
jgi:hypothetical protein